ncbi:MAG: ImmA/IrrE family metallo-endopeptidase [Myxococcales bacterium]
MREIVATIQAFVDFPKIRLADSRFSSDPALIRDEDIERLAGEVRAAWNLGDGPISDVVSLLEAMGCVVATFAFGAHDLSAFSQGATEVPYVLLNADETAAVRKRFNAAHELGHLLAHWHVPKETAARLEIHKELERQAHKFASAFLFPARSFAEEVYSLSIDALLPIKKRWGVSIQMIVRRARDLGMINQDRYERSCRELSRRGYRTKEPLDDTLPVETPKLLSKSIAMMIDEKVTTRGDLLHRLPFSPADIEILTSMPRGYLSSADWGHVTDIGIRPRTEPSNTALDGDLIPFRPRPVA